MFRYLNMIYLLIYLLKLALFCQEGGYFELDF
jgi:hypothetical protein